MIETILVATDGSEDGNAAEQTALGLASRLRSKLMAISVVDERRFKAPAGSGLNLPAFPEAEVAAYYRARADAVARRFNDRARGEGLDATCEVLQGPCDDRIVEKSQSADLLVIGRNSAGSRDKNSLVGHTTDTVLRKISKPTILVPAGAPLTGPLVLGFDGSPGSRIAAKLAVEIANGLNEAVHVFVDSKDKGRAVARLEWVKPADALQAWEIFSRYRDKAWSFTDCISFVVMNRLKIQQAFAFDEHFRQFGTVAVVPN